MKLRSLHSLLLSAALTLLPGTIADAAPLVVRKNVLRLSATEKQNFIAAVRRMKIMPSSFRMPGETINAYDWLVRLHRVGFDSHLTGGSGVHMAPSFFPWHREFLRAFEGELRLAAAQVQITAPIAIPYWDWTDANCTRAVVAPSFLGGNGGGPNSQFTSGPILTRPSPYRALTGAFATANDRSSTFPVSVDPDISSFSTAAGTIQPVRFFLQRSFSTDPIFEGGYAGGEPPPSQPDQKMLDYLPSAAQVSTGLQMTAYDIAPWDNTVEGTVPYAQRTTFRNYMEGHIGDVDAQGNPVGTMMHGRVHLWVGANMLSASSPNDPVFWMHHANLDRIWAEWQDLHGIRNFPAQWTYKNAAGELPNVFINDDLFGFTIEDGYHDDISSSDTLGLRDSGVIYDTQDFLPVLTLDAVTPAQATLRFRSIYGRQYTLRQSSALTAWTNAAAAVNGTGEDITIQVALPPGERRMYFHLTVAYLVP